MTEYTDVTVKVPTHLVGNFYEAVGQWLIDLTAPPDGRERDCEACGRSFVPARGGTSCSPRCRNRVKYARRKASRQERNGGASKCS